MKLQPITTRAVRAAFEFYAVTQEGKSAGAALAEFEAWLTEMERRAIEHYRPETGN